MRRLSARGGGAAIGLGPQARSEKTPTWTVKSSPVQVIATPREPDKASEELKGNATIPLLPRDVSDPVQLDQAVARALAFGPVDASPTTQASSRPRLRVPRTVSQGAAGTGVARKASSAAM